MQTKEAMTIPYVVYESLLDKTDLQHKRMAGIIILLVILIVASNIAWLYAEGIQLSERQVKTRFYRAERKLFEYWKLT